MCREWSRAVPPEANTASPSLVGSGKIWSVMVTRPLLAKISTEDRSTSTRRVTVPAAQLTYPDAGLRYGREVGIGRSVPDVDQPAVAHGHDLPVSAVAYHALPPVQVGRLV